MLSAQRRPPRAAVVTLAGPIWERFPAPHQLTVRLATDLYEGCGLSLHHIELLTGQPMTAVSALFHASDVQLRPAGGRSPFMRRWPASRPRGRGTRATPGRGGPAEWSPAR